MGRLVLQIRIVLVSAISSKLSTTITIYNMVKPSVHASIPHSGAKTCLGITNVATDYPET